jgi:hypothetical protein
VNLALPTFVTLLFFSSVIQEVVILITYLNWSLRVGMLIKDMLTIFSISHNVQQLMWTKLNQMMLKHRFPKPNFKGFMANSTQANWNAVRIIYGSGDLLLRQLTRNAFVYSIGLNHSINTPNNWSDLNCKMNSRFFAISIRMAHPLGMMTIFMF